ncbi:hypothetical protein [Vibrio quintilis]|uniref:Uncharacterized protein n=1 Tax=Vibrio quintilis TaxID=1117707 RepID=A0A1M7YP10_9VIBR|nr:hypothetical protein [Vibrio quintilis]SHO54372.1 hypothetical protein VQ7734_00086 [Vibrio quintilis]
MSVAFRNGYEAFIHKNISQILISEGHDTASVNQASDFAIDIYRNTASFGKARGGGLL